MNVLTCMYLYEFLKNVVLTVSTELVILFGKLEILFSSKDYLKTVP